MVTLSKFTFKWKTLNTALNTIVDAVNRNSPLPGDNIHLDEKGQSGVSINAVRDSNSNSADSQGQSGGGITGTLQQVTLFDTNGNPVTLKVWTDGNAPSTSTLKWQSVNTVDPATCAPGSITVLTHP